MLTGDPVTIPVGNPEQPFGAGGVGASPEPTPRRSIVRSLVAVALMVSGWAVVAFVAFLVDLLGGFAWLGLTALVVGTYLAYEEV